MLYSNVFDRNTYAGQGAGVGLENPLLILFWQVHTTKTLAAFLTSILLSQLPPTKGNIDEN